MRLIQTLNHPIYFSPARHINKTMEYFGMDEQTLAKAMGISLREVKSILSENPSPLTRKNAMLLEKVLQIDAQTLLNIDNSYRLWLAEQAKPATTHKAVSVTLKPARKNTRKTPAIAD
jgi:plasmid maintenance system antidote protein VapI